MSDIKANPPLNILPSFNTNQFIADDSTDLTFNDTRYLKLSGGYLTGDLYCSNPITTCHNFTASTNLTQNCLYLNNNTTTPLVHYSDSKEYQIIIQNNTTTTGKLTGMAFLNTADSIYSTAPSATITANRTGTHGIADLCFAVKASTSCNEALRILSTSEVGIGTITPSLQLEVNHATGSCFRLRYNDSASLHCDFLLGSSGQLKIQPAQYTVINSGYPNQLSLNKTNLRTINANDTADAYSFVIASESTATTKQIGMAFSVNPDYKLNSPGAAITFESLNTNGPGDLIFHTKEGNTTTSNCVEHMRLSHDGLLGLGTASPLYPLHINKTESVDIADYGYVNSSGSTGTTATGTANDYSLFTSGRIACTGEIDCISDRRAKTNIESLDLNYCKKFVKKVEPVMYNYINEPNKKSTGYIAQDVYKLGFHDLISLINNPKMVESTDSDGFLNPKKLEFCISTGEIIAMLHTCIRDLYKEVEKLKSKKTDFYDGRINSILE